MRPRAERQAGDQPASRAPGEIAFLRLGRGPFNEKEGTVAYRWRADERAFAMPIKVGDPSRWQLIRPTADWQLMPTTLTPETFKVATDLYYVEVAILDANGRPVK